jgi:hypothetical protein
MPAHAPPSPLDAAELAAALLRIADALAWPLLLLDEAGHLRHANRAAHQLLATEQPLRLTARGLVQPAAAKHRADFTAALQSASAGSTSVLHWPHRNAGFTGTLQPLPAARGEPPLSLLSLAAAEPGPARRR